MQCSQLYKTHLRFCTPPQGASPQSKPHYVCRRTIPSAPKDKKVLKYALLLLCEFMQSGLVTPPPMTLQNKPASADNTTHQLHNTPNGDDQAAEGTFRSTDFHFASFNIRCRSTRLKISSY